MKFAIIHFHLCTFCQCISEHQSLRNKLPIEAAIFSEQHRLYQNKSRHLKQLLFRKKFFCRLPSCLEQLHLSNNYFLVTNTFFDRLLLEDKYFFSTATISEKLLLHNYYNYSKHVLFRSRQVYFFRRGTFLGAGISWEQSLFFWKASSA